MAQTHMDSEHARNFMERLTERAGKAVAAAGSLIASDGFGSGGRQWQAGGVHCEQLPPDEQGIIRISIGGGPSTPVQMNYCTFRGKHSECVDLLRKALAAMERGEDD